MNNYDFDINLFGKMSITVIAEGKKQAKEMIDDMLDKLTVKNIELQEFEELEDIEVKDSDFKKTIVDKDKRKEFER